MKTIVALLLLWVPAAFADPLNVELVPNTDKNTNDTLNLDYNDQLVEKFNFLLESDVDLQVRFAKFESPPKESAGGRYMGYSATPFILHQSVDVDFLDSGGKREYRQTIVIYYSFAEGYRKGMGVNTGVFAVFRLSGKQSFDHKGGDEFELVKHNVSAVFEGFTRTINAEGGGGQPATRPESK